MDKNLWLKWGISGLLALASGRTTLFGTMYPCPAALMAAIIGEKYSGWKVALLCAVSLWLGRHDSLAVWADVLAAGAVWLAMMVLRSRTPAAVSRAVIAAGIWTVTKGAVLLRMSMFYRYGIEGMAAESALIVAFTYIFFKLYAYIQAGKAPLGRPEVILMIVTTVATLVQGVLAPLVRIMPDPVGQIQLLKTGMFLVTLWIGHQGGMKEGAVAGVTAGTLLSGFSAASPALTTVLACGGMVSGLCGNEPAVLAAFGFSAVTLFFGLAQGMATLYMPVYVPLLASVLFVLTPPKAAERLREIFPPENGRSGYNLAARQYILRTLEGYQNAFQYLSRAYILQRESFHEDPDVRSGRMIMAYQFKGMADAVDKLAAEIRTPAALASHGQTRFRLSVGRAGFARDGQVSGDSVYCGEIRKDRYAVALSDGMGNGRRAAEESNLTVQTIHRLLSAGFQPELALRIMNSILLYRAGDEIYSTLDLALFDLQSGELQLYKIGGSITFIKRGNNVEVVKIPALPMGIVGDIDVPSITCRLKPGDQVMLLSDGVAEAGRGQGIQWLTEAIASLSSADPQTLADLLINKAVERWGIKEKDDMTAVVVVVH